MDRFSADSQEACSETCSGPEAVIHTMAAIEAILTTAAMGLIHSMEGTRIIGNSKKDFCEIRRSLLIIWFPIDGYLPPAHL